MPTRILNKCSRPPACFCRLSFDSLHIHYIFQCKLPLTSCRAPGYSCQHFKEIIVFNKEYFTIPDRRVFIGSFIFIIGLVLLLSSLTLYSHTPLYAVAILVMCLSTFWLLSCMKSLRDKCLHYSLTAFLSGSYCFAFLFITTLSFCYLPKGTEIRPMGYALSMGVVGIISFSSGLIFSILSLIKGKKKRWFLNISAMIYCLSIIWIINTIFHHIVKTRELILAP